MAIAGLVITLVPNAPDGVMENFLKQENIIGGELTSDLNKFVAALEISADRVEKKIEKLQELENILSIDIAYINYEDDIAKNGEVPCPPDIMNRIRS